jgi:hypothetical protein
MTVDEPHAKAHQAIGAYFCAFSALERELGEAIKVIFRLEKHEASDTIVAALGDVSKKVNLVWAASLLAKNTDGSETSHDWKKKVHKTMGRIWACTDNRNQLAHSFLLPNDDGSVEFARISVRSGVLKRKNPNKWPQSRFYRQVTLLKALASQIQSMVHDLSVLKITIPDAGWIHIDDLRPTRQFSSAPWQNLHAPGGHSAGTPAPARDVSNATDS